MINITLSQGDTAVIDDDDYERVSRFKWSSHRASNGKCYPMVNINKLPTKLPNFILNTDKRVYHMNKDYLDCRKVNLSLVPDKMKKFVLPAPAKAILTVADIAAHFNMDTPKVAKLLIALNLQRMTADKAVPTDYGQQFVYDNGIVWTPEILTYLKGILPNG